MASSKRPPVELDELTNNLKHSSGKGVNAFFPSQSEPQFEKQIDQKAHTDSPTGMPSVSHAKPTSEPKLRSHDVTTSLSHDVDFRKWRDIIEDTETRNSSLRITSSEKYDIEDLIGELERKYKIKTSLNEIARLGILYLIDDFKKGKLNSLIMKVKKS
jgi:hypothetical protein